MDLVLCYIASAQAQAPPMALVGELVSQDNNRVVLKGPVSSDIAYFSMLGKRLRPLVEPKDIYEAKEDKSMRALPQLAPSDFVMMGCTSCADYIKSTMTIYENHLVYMSPLATDSTFHKAYTILMDQLNRDTPLAEFFNDSVFDFDSAHYLTKLMNPEEVKDVLVPVAVGQDK